MPVRKAKPDAHIHAYDPSRVRCHAGRLSDEPIELSDAKVEKLIRYWSKPQHYQNMPVRYRPLPQQELYNRFAALTSRKEVIT